MTPLEKFKFFGGPDPTADFTPIEELFLAYAWEQQVIRKGLDRAKDHLAQAEQAIKRLPSHSPSTCRTRPK
jgi:phytoene/squalene synthetase